MTYAIGNLIQSTDFNALVGGNPTTTANTLNTVWATGGTTAGYGQTAVPQVSAGATITASNWSNLVGKTSNAAAHQGTTILAVTIPVVGGAVSYQANITTNLATINNTKLNTGVQGSSTANTATVNTTWSQGAQFTHTVTFANGDAARYFFNAGGQLKITCSHPNTTAGINLLMNQLASNVGTIVQSAPTSTSVAIAGIVYTGITKIGGGGNTPTVLSTTSGYYNMSTTPVIIFRQTATGSPASYVGSYIQITMVSNGTQGSNGDRGNIITIYTFWDEIPNGLTVGAGAATTLTAVAPETTYLANTWGTISISGTVFSS